MPRSVYIYEYTACRGRGATGARAPERWSRGNALKLWSKYSIDSVTKESYRDVAYAYKFSDPLLQTNNKHKTNEIDFYHCFVPTLSRPFKFRGRIKVMSTIVSRWISRKPIEVEVWFQRTNNKKWHIWPNAVTVTFMFLILRYFLLEMGCLLFYN